MTRAHYSEAELVERVDFTIDHALMRFRLEPQLHFRPGQYATIALEAGGKLIARAYSIVSSPHEPLLEFFVELVPEGALTPRLWELKPGDRALIRNHAAGKLLLEEESGVDTHLMVATVTGVAPFISIARTLAIGISRGDPARHRLGIIHSGSRSEELGVYKDELSGLARDGWLDYTPTVSRPWEDPDWRGETGRAEDVVRKHADRLGFDHASTAAYVCGHPNMIENVRGVLRRARFSPDRIHEEKYFPTPKS
jgi:ferredoxin--NADP+ reductase